MNHFGTEQFLTNTLFLLFPPKTLVGFLFLALFFLFGLWFVGGLTEF